MGQMYLQGFELRRVTSAAIQKLVVLPLFLLPLAAQQPEYEVPQDADRVEIYRTVGDHQLRVWIYEPGGPQPLGQSTRDRFYLWWGLAWGPSGSKLSDASSLPSKARHGRDCS